MSERIESAPSDRSSDMGAPPPHETAAPPPQEHTAAPPPPVPEPRRGSSMPLLYGLGFLILAGGIYAAWAYPRKVPSPDLQGVQQQMADLLAFLRENK